MIVEDRRHAWLRTTALAIVLSAGLAGQAIAADQTYQFDIPAESLDQALNNFSQTSAQQIIYSDEAVAGRKTGGLHGRYTVQQALDALLAGSGLHVETNASGVMMVKPKNAQAASNQPAVETVSQSIETVTVTAEKKAERASEVPMSLTALSGEELSRTQSYRFEDYVGKIPGLNAINSDGLGSQLVIRGISNGVGGVNSMVATYIDETPYTSHGPFADSTIIAPNLDTFDMERIEVLRGPQGTLYGASALAGLLKYVTNAPDPSAVSAKFEAGSGSVDNGEFGYDIHGMVNVPLSDDAAVRVVGYDNYYPGFIDDPSRGIKDINGSHFSGARASLLFEPNDDLSIRFSALFQVRQWDDWGNEDVNPTTLSPVYGPLIQENLISQPGKNTNQLYNMTVNWNAGFANVLSTTSYFDDESQDVYDYSKELGAAVSYIFGGSYGLALTPKTHVHAFTEELRLASHDNDQFQWQAGLYFTTEGAVLNEPYWLINANTDQILFNYPTNVGDLQTPTQYREYACAFRKPRPPDSPHGWESRHDPFR